jgi:hypothetical protein
MLLLAKSYTPTSSCIWRPCPECREASKHQLLKFGFLLLVRLNLGFTTEGNLLLCSSYLPLGVPNWVLHRTIKHFSGAVAGEKEDFCKGSISRSTFYFVFVLLYFTFTCIILSKIPKISFLYSCYFIALSSLCCSLSMLWRTSQ